MKACLEEEKFFNIMLNAVRTCVTTALADALTRVANQNENFSREALLAFSPVTL